MFKSKYLFMHNKNRCTYNDDQYVNNYWIWFIEDEYKTCLMLIIWARLYVKYY